jgi:Cysteine-rich secretory protein family
LSRYLALGCSVLGLWLVGCAEPVRAKFGSGLPQVTATPELASQERAMFQLVNRDRQAAGLPKLEYDESLADVARSHSADMRDHHFFDHVSPTTGLPDDRLNAAGYAFQTARENLSEAPDVATSQTGLMNSPHHHENIMAKDVTHVGVGIVNGGVQDARNLTVTQLFATPSRVETDAQARANILHLIQQARASLSLARVPENARLRELAERYVVRLTAAQLEADLQAVGEPIAEDVSRAQDKTLRAVSVGAQLLGDSTGFTQPPALSDARAAAFGIAVRTVPGEGGRPMRVVLVLVSVR